MTSKVTVTAHCGTDKAVHIDIETASTGQVMTLKNGQTVDLYVYDDRVVSVREVVELSGDGQDSA